MDSELRRQLARSGYHQPGFAERYDRYRPRPPIALLELLPPLAGVERPRLVVDLGSGTGLSTRFWADDADEVVGIEPNDAMRAWAEESTREPNVRYVAAPRTRPAWPTRARTSSPPRSRCSGWTRSAYSLRSRASCAGAVSSAHTNTTARAKRTAVGVRGERQRRAGG